jgi:hypothetical protein
MLTLATLDGYCLNVFKYPGNFPKLLQFYILQFFKMVRRKPSEVRRIKSSRRSEEAIKSSGRLDENSMCNKKFVY